MRRARRRTAVIATLAVAGAAAAGMSGVAIAASSTKRLSADANGAQLEFSTKTIRAKPGTVNLVMSNKGRIQHNVSVRGKGITREGKTVGGGGVSKVTFKAKKGTYTFYCSVPGHELGGMKGRVIVK